MYKRLKQTQSNKHTHTHIHKRTQTHTAFSTWKTFIKISGLVHLVYSFHPYILPTFIRITSSVRAARNEMLSGKSGKNVSMAGEIFSGILSVTTF